MRSFFDANKYIDRLEKGKSSASAKQIDRTAIKTFCQKVISPGSLPEGKYTSLPVLKRFGLIVDENPTNAGEVLFGSMRAGSDGENI